VNSVFTAVYNQKLKEIKKKIGSRCTLLGNRKELDGSRVIDVHLKKYNGEKVKFQLKFPLDLTVVTMQDYERVETLIAEQLNLGKVCQ